MSHLKRELAGWTRWLHIYLSMFSFAALLFFAFTGITLNHTEWIESNQVTDRVKGHLLKEWLENSSGKVNELMIVEKLRTEHHITSPLVSFLTEDAECSVSFKGPGYSADGFVDKETGAYELTITRSGVLAVLNDLHKGRDSGKTWSLLIDVSAVLMILVSLSGFLMIFFLKKKRASGLLISLLGVVLILMTYFACV